jgi:TDG/mug DNA glycosylase family protein
MLIYFVGLNPGLQTAATGHAYAHPSNLFWKLLHSSGITPDRLVPASEDRDLPRRYACGLTNIVSRPSRNGAELSRAEMDAGVAALEAKAARWRPEVMCIVGKSIWESVFRVRRGRGLRKGEFSYGWQDEAENMGVGVDPAAVEALGDGPGPEVDEGVPWAGSRVFVASSTSGLAATLSPAEKEKIWNELGAWCQKRRAERAQVGQT